MFRGTRSLCAGRVAIAPPPTVKHESFGQAIVTLADALSGAGKDKLLGKHITSASRGEYGRVIAEWEARGRQLDDAGLTVLTVAELLDRFLRHAEAYCGKASKECDHVDKATIPLLEIYRHKPARILGRGRVEGRPPANDRPPRGEPEVVNRRVNRIGQTGRGASRKGW